MRIRVHCQHESQGCQRRDYGSRSRARLGAVGLLFLGMMFAACGDDRDNARVTSPPLPPGFEVQPAMLDYGVIQVGREVTKEFRVWNTGGGTLRGHVALPPTGFVLEGTYNYV